MSQETYTKSEIDLKFDKISTDVQHSSEKSDLKFDALAKQLDLKFDNFENKLENLFANLKVDLANEKIESLEQARKDNSYHSPTAPRPLDKVFFCPQKRQQKKAQQTAGLKIYLNVP